MWLSDYLKKRAERRKVVESQVVLVKKEEPFVLNECNVCTEHERCSKLYKEQLPDIRETIACNVWFKAVMNNKVLIPIQRMSQDTESLT